MGKPLTISARGVALAATGMLALCATAVLAEDSLPALTVTTPYVDLHTGPGRGYPVTHSVERGDLVVLERQRTDWIKVQVSDDIQGWARQSELARSLGDESLVDLVEQPLRWKAGIAFGSFAGSRATRLMAGLQFSRNLTMQAHLTEAIGDFSTSQVARIELINEPMPAWRLSPYVGIGAGILNTTPDATLVQAEDRTSSLLSVTVGARYRLAQRYLMSLDYTHHTALTSRNYNEEVAEWTFGISALLSP